MGRKGTAWETKKKESKVKQFFRGVWEGIKIAVEAYLTFVHYCAVGLGYGLLIIITIATIDQKLHPEKYENNEED